MKYSLTKKQKQILSTIQEEYPKELSFTTLQKLTHISPRVLTKHLAILKDQCLINKKVDQNRKRPNWKDPTKESDNRQQSISITLKGQKKIYSLEIGNINGSLKLLQKISSGLRSNPSYIKEAITNQKHDIFLKNFSGKILTPELEREFFIKMRAPDVPLLDIFRNMHEIIRQEFVNGFDKSLKLSSMATVIKDGTLYLAWPEDLESDKLILFPI